MRSEKADPQPVLFYRANSFRGSPIAVPKFRTFKFWQPSLRSWKPKGIATHPKFIVWWLFHNLRVFNNRKFTIFLIYDEQHVVHASFIFPGFFRFGFMEKHHLQIGDVWTDPSARGQGLASFAVQKITERYASPSTTLWYLTAKKNVASIRAAEKAGFKLEGVGKRTNRLGLGLLGSYQISKLQTEDEDPIF